MLGIFLHLGDTHQPLKLEMDPRNSGSRDRNLHFMGLSAVESLRGQCAKGQGGLVFRKRNVEIVK